MQLNNLQDIWRRGRLPVLAHPYPATPAGFDDEQALDWRTALELVALIPNGKGMRRSYKGVNSTAQRRMPDQHVTIEFTEIILGVWRMAGLAALRDTIAKGRQPIFGGRHYLGVYDDPVRMAVTRVPITDDPVEVLVPGRTTVRQMDHPDERIWPWAVVAEATYGKYAFHVASQGEPSVDDVRTFCLWHTRVP